MPGLEYKPGVVVYILIESGRYALSALQSCASWHDMKLGLSVFWLPYSDPQSKPITNPLTNVLIVSVKYT